ncbi:hypothetical protein B0H12DRAFT_1124262, partial [Mycena haematopus]
MQANAKGRIPITFTRSRQEGEIFVDPTLGQPGGTVDFSQVLASRSDKEIGGDAVSVVGWGGGAFGIMSSRLAGFVFGNWPDIPKCVRSIRSAWTSV